MANIPRISVVGCVVSHLIRLIYAFDGERMSKCSIYSVHSIYVAAHETIVLTFKDYLFSSLSTASFS